MQRGGSIKSLSRKFFWILLIGVIFFFGVLTYFIVERETGLIREFFDQHTEIETHLVLLHLEELMSSHNTSGITSYIEKLNRTGGMNVGIFGRGGDPAFGTGTQQVLSPLPDTHTVVSTGTSLVFYRQIPNEKRCHACHGPQDNTRGTVVITHSTEKMQKEIRTTALRIIWAALLVGIASEFFLILTIRKMVLGPVGTLNEGAVMLKSGRLDHRIEKKTDDEIGTLVSCFNEMAESLEKSHANLEHAVRQKTKELRIAAELSSRVFNGNVPLTELMKQFLTSVTGDMGYEFAALCLIDREAGRLVEQCRQGMEGNICDLEISLTSNHPFIGAIREAQTAVKKPADILAPEAFGNVVIIPLLSHQRRRCSAVNLCTLEDCPAFHSADDRCWTMEDTLCRSPLAVAGKEKIYGCLHCPVFPVMGVFIAGRKTDVTKTSLHTLEIIASEMTSAIENQRFIEGKKHDIDNLIRLHEISVDVLQDIDISTIMQSVVSSATVFANMDAAVLLLKGADGTFCPETASGADMADLPGSIPADDPFIGMSAGETRIRETVKMSGVPGLHGFLNRCGFRYAAAVPLQYKGDFFGCILLLKRRDFLMTESEKAIVRLFSIQSAAAIHTARIYRSLEESEQRYRALIDDAHDAIYTLSTEGTFTSLNPAFERITGWQRDEWLGKSFISIIHPDDVPLALEVFRKTLQGGVPPLFELHIRTRAGGYVIGEFKIIPRMLGGKPAYILGIGRDVTERKRAEEERNVLISHLNVQKEFSDAIFNTMSMGVMVLDSGGSIVRINQAGMEILGIRFKDVVHSKLAEVLPGLSDFLAVNSELGRETELAAGTHVIPIGFTNAPLLDVDGHKRGIVVVFRDLTEIRKLQAEIRRKEHLAAMGRVLAGIAHEIRNPLFGISSIAQILASEGASPRHQELLKAMLKESGRMSRLMDELLLYTRTSRLDIRDIPLGSMLQEIQYSIQEKRPDILISSLIPPGLVIRADTDKIKQILLNLINNAIDAARSSVRISACVTGGSVEITIEDDGPGIAEEDREKIFEPFFTTKKGGTGLGLSICKKIIEDHGGTISAGASAGGGARMIVTLRT